MYKPHIIREYDSFTRGIDLDSKAYISLPEKTFDQLEQFILANKGPANTDALELLTLSSRKGIGKIISAKNYVGIIRMNDGTEIEILPKIYSPHDDNLASTKRVFLDMLKTLKEIPYKTFNVSNLKAENMSVFEVFIRMFIDEVFVIVKRGLKSDYISYSNNESFFKGKIQFSEHIKRNIVHKERAFVEYDIFNTNRPENSLIKSTLCLLGSMTRSLKNKKDISVLLTAFDEVEYSQNYENDFQRYVSDRNMKDYETALKWCRIFLLHKSFTAFAGSEVAYALLFPMEQVFESYVANKLAKALDKTRYSIKTQDKTHSLFDYPSKKFQLRPDIVIKDNTNNRITVLDTKWKLLSSMSHNYGISQSDMYQMYAYDKKYCSKKVLLLYPLNSSMNEEDVISYESSDGVIVRVICVDLISINESISKIIALEQDML